MNFLDKIKELFNGISGKNVKLLAADPVQDTNKKSLAEEITDIKYGPKLPTEFKKDLEVEAISQVAEKLGNKVAEYESADKPIDLHRLIKNMDFKINSMDIADLKKALELVEKSYNYGNGTTGRQIYMFSVDGPISMRNPERVSLQKRAVNDYVHGVKDALEIRNLMGEQDKDEKITEIITNRMKSIFLKTFGDRVGLNKNDDLNSVMERINQLFGGKLIKETTDENNISGGIIDRIAKGVFDGKGKDANKAIKELKQKISELVKNGDISRIEANYCLTGLNSYLPLVSKAKEMPRGYELMSATKLSEQDKRKIHEKPYSEIVFCGNGDGDDKKKEPEEVQL